MLYAQLWPLVFSMNFRMLRADRGLAEDASQDVFMRILQYTNLAEFSDKPDAFRSYVLAICRNVSLSYISKLVREPSFSQESGLDQVDKSENLPQRENTNPELVVGGFTQLSAYLSELEGQDQRLLALLMEGYSISEISKRLGLTYSNTGVRIHRLRKLLKEKGTY